MRTRKREQPVLQAAGQIRNRRGATRLQRDDAGGDRKQVLHPVMHFPQQQSLVFCRSFTLRYISSDLRRTDHTAFAVFNRRNRQGDIDVRAVFPATDGFEMVDPLACLDSREDCGLLTKAVLRNENGDGLTNGFLRRLSE
jgi:hypothetical protein